MKLFEKYNINRSSPSGIFKVDVLLSFGKLFYEKNVEVLTTLKGLPASGFNKTLAQEGRFIRFELPFAKTKTYTCPNDFEVKTGKCRPTWLFTWRRPRDKTIFTRIFAWRPM